MESGDWLQFASVLASLSALAIPFLGPSVVAGIWRPNTKWIAVGVTSVGLSIAYGLAKLLAIAVLLQRFLTAQEASLLLPFFFATGLLFSLSRHSEFDPEFEFDGRWSQRSHVGRPDEVRDDQKATSAALVLLGLNGDLSTHSTRDIQHAWRCNALKHHPDCGGNPQMFRELTEARDLLISEIRELDSNR